MSPVPPFAPAGILDSSGPLPASSEPGGELRPFPAPRALGGPASHAALAGGPERAAARDEPLAPSENTLPPKSE